MKLLNKRQSILVIKYFSKSTSLLNELEIDQFEHIYIKFMGSNNSAKMIPLPLCKLESILLKDQFS